MLALTKKQLNNALRRKKTQHFHQEGVGFEAKQAAYSNQFQTGH